jgi:four helix bundle protein
LVLGLEKNLEIYQLAHDLAVVIHKFSLNLPKYELYETGSQIRRSSKSISTNIVEGFGRRKYIADYLRFLIYAQASCDETIEWMSYIIDCHQDVKVSAESILDDLNILGKKMNRFIDAVGKRLPTAHPINKVVAS